MSRLATSFVLGYHGCDRSVGVRIVNGFAELRASNRDFDWLGPGAYFWEADPVRAREWAEWKASIGHYSHPFVVGAVIDLRNCLDLVRREDVELLASAFRSFKTTQQKAGLPMPRNRNAPGGRDADRTLRFLDCAVIRHLHWILESQQPTGVQIEPYDTVRGMFLEGRFAYPGGRFRRKSHVQIAVRNQACIKGLFLPRL